MKYECKPRRNHSRPADQCFVKLGNAPGPTATGSFSSHGSPIGRVFPTIKLWVERQGRHTVNPSSLINLHYRYNVHRQDVKTCHLRVAWDTRCKATGPMYLFHCRCLSVEPTLVRH